MIKRTLIAAADTLGIWSISRRLTRSAPRIFMLHRFSERPRPRATHVDELVRFIRRVGAECEFVTMRELLARQVENSPRTRPLAAITVDDGYEDFYSVALPILDELKVPATLYATTGFIDRQCWLWWDALRYLIDLHPPGPLEMDVAGQHVSAQLGDQSSRNAAWSQVADLLVKQNAPRTRAIEQLEARVEHTLPDEPTHEYGAMSWAQLQEAEKSGIEIGGHTMTHAFLPALDAEGLRHEIDAAKVMMEQHLTQELTTFAYPNGMPYDYTPAVIDRVRAAGFSAAVVAHPAPHCVRDPYRIGRWSTPADEPQMDHILSGASELKLRARGRLRN